MSTRASIKHRSVEELGGEASVLARQRRDHAEMSQLMARHQALPDGTGREEILQQLIQLVFSHAFAEETVLWPAVRRRVADGEALTAQVEEEHQQINDLTTDIERLPPGDLEREDKIRRVFSLIRQDIRDEEDELLPRLRDVVDAEQLRRLGTAWDAVRKSAPTHPHPAVPRRPPGNALLGVPLSAYDRLRDAFGLSTYAAAGRTKAVTLTGALIFAGAGIVAARRKRR
ncbi:MULTISPECIES: hemerythrin domain-containing protein [Streptomyces]|uniref:hemerythrin domain-containing protein n=1 Tax=Streptomyces TaxID=1883 RepID=UPI001E48D6A3|nr:MULTISPECIES: hemerythrin domain-containing protein [Streptomyces]UFQ19410.1 hemerythrin domain-containing protein [Streptomyces huasconensis]WCL89031.1 hemerythrin domain-containing protein [Streptomyces sp. JCM 35825]